MLGLQSRKVCVCVCASYWERSGPCGLLKAAQNSFSPLAFCRSMLGMNGRACNNQGFHGEEEKKRKECDEA